MADARTFANALAATFSDGDRAALVDDPIAAIPTLAPLQVLVRDREKVATSTCSVEGLYREGDGLIEVLPAMSRRRTKFTALHEFGHHLARRSVDTARALAAAHRISPQHSRKLEERIADAFAAELLVPDATVMELLEGRAPTAEDVRDLFELTEGSREACCVRIAQWMAANGYVLLAEDRTIRFCAVAGDAYAIRRGAVQDDDHLIARAARLGSARADQIRLRHPSAIQTREYGGQAVLASDGYTYAVLTDATSLPWGGWRTPGDVHPAGIDMECDGCGEDVEAWKRCLTCGGPICPRCGWCSCSAPRRARVADKRCVACQQMRRVDLFAPGSDTCVDCA